MVTTSWDDGHPLDGKIAELLSKHGLPGCFYVPRENPENPVMELAALKDLASKFEIGGHTLSHIRLTQLPIARVRDEVTGCKKWLEDTLGRAVPSFCYPGGFFDDAIVDEVKRAGFALGRTADWLCVDDGSDRFRVRPSLHVYPHSRITHVAHCLRRHPRSLVRYLIDLRADTDLVTMTEKLGEIVVREGGALHVWGHSWEIDRLGLWQQLDRLLAVLAALPKSVRRVDNAGLCAS